MFFLLLKMQYCQQTQQQTRTLLFQVLPKGMNYKIKKELVIERLGGFRWQFSLFYGVFVCAEYGRPFRQNASIYAAIRLSAAEIDMYVHSVLLIQYPTLALPLVEMHY